MGMTSFYFDDNPTDATVVGSEGSVSSSDNANAIDLGAASQKIKDKIKAIHDHDFGLKLLEKNKVAMRMSIIGGLAGAGFGYFKHKNIIISAVIGVVGGLILGNVIAPKSTTKEEDDNN